MIVDALAPLRRGAGAQVLTLILQSEPCAVKLPDLAALAEAFRRPPTTIAEFGQAWVAVSKTPRLWEPLQDYLQALPEPVQQRFLTVDLPSMLAKVAPSWSLGPGLSDASQAVAMPQLLPSPLMRMRCGQETVELRREAVGTRHSSAA